MVLAGAGGGLATHVTLFDQGFVQVLQAAVVGLRPTQPYVLGLSSDPKGAGPVVPLVAFTANPAGAAIVDAVGPINQYLDSAPKRYLVITEALPRTRANLYRSKPDPEVDEGTDVIQERSNLDE